MCAWVPKWGSMRSWVLEWRNETHHQHGAVRMFDTAVHLLAVDMVQVCAWTLIHQCTKHSKYPIYFQIIMKSQFANQLIYHTYLIQMHTCSLFKHNTISIFEFDQCINSNEQSSMQYNLWWVLIIYGRFAINLNYFLIYSTPLKTCEIIIFFRTLNYLNSFHNASLSWTNPPSWPVLRSLARMQTAVLPVLLLT